MIARSASGNTVFSSEVRLELELGDEAHSVAAVGPDRFVLAQPQQLDDGDAVLVITVNGEPRRTLIRLIASPVPTREFAYSVR
jgi:hypothetical protein